MKDVQNFQNKLNNSLMKVKEKQINQLNNCSKCSKKEDLQRQASSSHINDQDGSSDYDRIRSKYKDQSCQTDTVEARTHDTSENVEQEINGNEKNTDIQFWNRLVNGKNAEIYKLHQKIANLDSKAKKVDNSVLEVKAQLSRKCREKSDLEKDFRKYRENKRELDTKVHNLERDVKELEVQLSKKREENNLLNKDLRKYKDYSYEVISAKDKKITNLITKEKNLNKEVGDIKVELSKKVEDLKVELSKYKKDNTEILLQKDERIVKLTTNAKELEKNYMVLKAELSKQNEGKKLKDVENLKVELSKKREEIVLLEMNFNKHEEQKNRIISEKDETISNLNAKVRDLEEKIQELKIQLSNRNEEKSLCEKDFLCHKDRMAKIISEKVLKISDLGMKAENLEKDLVTLKVQLTQKCEEKILIEQNFENYKDYSIKTISEKDQKIKNLDIEQEILDKKIKELEQEIMDYKKRTTEETSEKDWKIVTLALEAKNLRTDIEELKVQLSEKCKEIVIIEQDFKKYKDCREKEISVKDLEIKNLGIKVTKLDNDITELHSQFSKLQHDFKKYKKHTNEEISEKDQKIENLDIISKNLDKEKILLKKDLKKYKELTDEIISKYKMKNENTLADMNDKMKRYREVFCLMKDSIAGMAAMHEDTSDKLMEAVNNSCQASKVVGKDLVCRFQELEKVVTSISQDKMDTFPILSVKKDIFKSETTDAWQALNCQLERSSNDGAESVESLGETCGKEKTKNLKRKFSD